MGHGSMEKKGYAYLEVFRLLLIIVIFSQIIVCQEY